MTTRFLASLAVLGLSGTLGTGPAMAEEVTFKDLAGHDITLDGPADNIVAIINPTAIDVIAIDQSAARLSGINPTMKRLLGSGIIADLVPEVTELNDGIIGAGGGFTPNVEAIAALDPDIVVQWGNRGDDLIAPLENAGLTVARYAVGLEEIAQANLTMVGAMTGNDDRAAQLIAWRNDTWAAIEAATAAVPPENRLSVAAFSSAEGGFSVTGDATQNDVTIKLVGGINAGAEIAGQNTVNAEQIALWDPDVIMIWNATDRKAVLDHPLLSLTKAAQSGRVYLMPTGSSSWAGQGLDNPLAWMWLANLLYPDVHAFDIRSEAAKWLQFMYGAELNEAQLDRILAVEANAGALNYETMLASTN